MCDAGRMGHHLAPARPAAGGLGVPEGAALLRHDHSAALWRAGLFALCAFRSRAADFGVLRDGGRDGHGAEFIGPG
ncbi:hypothetical protein G6F57_023209 [Rhizopus arrhizus]|nr:hypothetical protein G6F40_017916 [Rhizopus arrhizus]KAG1428141.1 hypothetical protein G6F57_023209 [Rhizopus arrhizus]